MVLILSLTIYITKIIILLCLSVSNILHLLQTPLIPVGFANNINPNLIIHFAPYIQVENNKFSLIKSSPSSSEVSILSQYQNKHIRLWFCKSGNLYELGLCSGTYYDSENVNVNHSFQANRKLTNLPYYVQKVGFSKNFYDLNSKYSSS